MVRINEKVLNCVQGIINCRILISDLSTPSITCKTVPLILCLLAHALTSSK